MVWPSTERAPPTARGGRRPRKLWERDGEKWSRWEKIKFHLRRTWVADSGVGIIGFFMYVAEKTRGEAIAPGDWFSL